MKAVKIFAVISAAAICAGLPACGDSSTAADTQTSESTAERTTEGTTEQTTEYTTELITEGTTAQITERTTEQTEEAAAQTETTASAQGYTDRELCEMTRRYYGSRKNYVPGHISIEAESEADGTVSIHLYNDEDGHVTTCDWFYIDRKTGKGTSFTDGAVDLTEPEAVLWEPDVSVRSKIKEGTCCALLYLGYTGATISGYIEGNAAYRSLTLVDEDMKCLYGMPQQFYAESDAGQEIYAVIPAADVKCAQVYQYDALNGKRLGMIYSSYYNLPFLLRCNVSEIMPDVQVVITDSSGKEHVFSPYISGMDGSPKADPENEVTVLNPAPED